MVATLRKLNILPRMDYVTILLLAYTFVLEVKSGKQSQAKDTSGMYIFQYLFW